MNDYVQFIDNFVTRSSPAESASDISKQGLERAISGALDASYFGNKNESTEFSISVYFLLFLFDLHP